MRVLISGLIGAAASAAVWFYLIHATGHEMGWLAIGVGLVTGLCVHAGAGSTARESTGRAVLAMVLALTAIVGGRLVYAKVMQNLNQVKNIANVAVVQEEVEGADEEVVAEGEAIEEVPIVLPSERSGKPLRFEKPKGNDGGYLDLIYMGVAALVAYVTGGRGQNKVEPVEADASMPTVDSTGDATTA